jgi:hypothetical protein
MMINVDLTKEIKKQINFFVALKIEICKEQKERCLTANSVLQTSNSSKQTFQAI